MFPDYGGALFWDEEGRCIGGYDNLYAGEGENEIELDPLNIEGLEEWYYDRDGKSLYQTNHWTDSQWKEWWVKGLEFAKAVKAKLPANVELYYFSLLDPIWKVRPEDTNDGGLFNEGKPIKIE